MVDIANMTLEHYVLREVTGSRCSYTAVLTANKKRDPGTYDRGTDEWLRDKHIFRHMNLITWTVEFDNKGLADPGSCKLGTRNDGFIPEKQWKGTFETKGFWPVECWHHITTI